MTFAPKIRRYINRVIPFGLLWLIFSLIYCVLERGILGDLHQYPSTGLPYSFAKNILVIPIGGFMIGLLTGVLEIGYFGKWFAEKCFARKILVKSLIYLLIVIAFLTLLTLVNSLYMNSQHTFKSLSGPAVAFITDYAVVGILLYMASVIVITQFYAEFSESLGAGTLLNFFLGRYHHPRTEERIFMFVDMKSSTTIAENLGHVRYFAMLKAYFYDLSAAVIDHAGEIYQYAGDEMIVSWTLKAGLKNNNSIECFFSMKRAIVMKSEKYLTDFGIVPMFKAGLHYGTVTAGEIGTLKKEIVFTGDVLNTSARIQSLCNQFDADLLISDDLVNILKPQPSWVIESVGEHLLKGRNKPMELFKLRGLS